MPKRAYSEIVGYDRSKGGVQRGGKKKWMAQRKSTPKTLNALVLKAIKKTQELKCLDIPILVENGIDIDYSSDADCFLLNPIQEGEGISKRIGLQVHLESLRIRGELRAVWDYTSAADFPDATLMTYPTQMVRMLVVYDKFPNSASTVPNYNEVVEQILAGGTDTNGLWANANVEAGGRFEILRDKTWVMDPAIATGIATSEFEGGRQSVGVYVDEFIKVNRDCKFSATSNPITTADIAKGALYLYFRANLKILGTNTGFVRVASVVGTSAANHFNTRLRYRDS